MAEHTRLRDRFHAALESTGAAPATDDADRVFDELVERHGEAHRRYHTLDHVGACLGWLDWYAGHAERPAEVALALFFHDAIYDPRAQDNEAASAALAEERLAELGAPRDTIDRIVAPILATRAHDAAPGDARLVVDLDLTILGSRPAVYGDFERRIRQEYAHVPSELFVPGRRRVLEGFLDRDAIYWTAPLADELEASARRNLERRIAELSAAEAGKA